MRGLQRTYLRIRSRSNTFLPKLRIMDARSGSGVIYTKDMKERKGLKMENPFTLKVGQVFTGFGIGCGIGIGVGRPLNLGAIPVLNQVMVATRGATDAFSGVQRHVNSSLRKVGAKNIEVGIGCGVGFGHGFGVGLAVKPGVLHQIQSQFLQMATSMITKLGIDNSTFSVNQGILPESLQTGTSMVKEASHGNHVGIISQPVKSIPKSKYEGNNREAAVTSEETILAPKSAAQYSSRTENVLNNFLTNPLLKEEGTSLHEQFSFQAGALQLESNVLQMVLKHQLLIEQLMQENEKLRQILVKELKVQPSKLQSSFTSRSKYFSCTECYECRRKQRRR